MKLTTSLLASSLLTISLFSADFTSKYVGEETRQIKSLSKHDIKELKKGAGWGLAKAAELNGVPGPAHILEMESKINLTKSQKSKIEKIYKSMNQKARVLGEELIFLESELNRHFKERTINQELLEKLVKKIEKVRAELRIVHLSTHLKTPNILTHSQISLYNKLRGYSKKDPCKHIPKGHDPHMWKMHNGCD